MDARTETKNNNMNASATLAAEQSARVMMLEAELKRSEENCQSYLKSLQKEQEEFTRVSDENASLKKEKTQLKLETTEYAEKEEAYLAALLRAQEEIEKLKSELHIKKMMPLPQFNKMFNFSRASSTEQQATKQHSFEP
jgi:chromosome segregation ATPase